VQLGLFTQVHGASRHGSRGTYLLFQILSELHFDAFSHPVLLLICSSAALPLKAAVAVLPLAE
jgi:hypothetical protein